MKKINFLIIIVGGLLMFAASGCSKALEEKPFTFLSPANFYKNETDAKAAINGVYAELYTYDLYRQPYIALTVLDDDHVSGADWYVGATGAGNPQAYWGISRPWTGYYTIISRANTVIENVSTITNIDETIKNRILGEAYFLRGWSYLNLVQMYGGVPLRLKSLSADANANVPRSTVAETFKVVVDDLKMAESMLLPVDDSKAGEPGRVNLDVAKAFLAKAYLVMASGAKSGVSIKVRGGNDNGYYTHTKNVVAGYNEFNATEYFTLARDKALEVINSGRYSLFTGSWNDIWKKENRNKGENMWMLQSAAGSEFVNDIHSYFNARSTFGVGAVWFTNHHYNNYDASDKRVLEGVTHNYVANWGTPYYYPSWEPQYQVVEGVTYFNDGAGDNKAYTTKFNFVENPMAGNSDAFYPLLRYSEVLLTYAEAENEINGGSANAYARLNEVRSRAAATAAPAGMSQDDFRSYVLEERAREFVLENGIRHFDLMRWGIYLQVMNKITSQQNNINKQRAARNLLLPIPIEEINSNKALPASEQNPGW